MADLDLARQLVAYVDATTEPVAPPSRFTEEDVLVLSPDRRPQPRRPWIMAAAAAAVLLVGGLLLLIAADEPAQQLEEPLPPPSPPTPTAAPQTVPDAVDDVGGGRSEREQVALDTAASYLAAISANDDDAVLSMSDPATVDAAVETNAVRWWWATAWPLGERVSWPSGACEVTGVATAEGVPVTCPIEVTDPVAAEIGIAPLSWSMVVGDDGFVRLDSAPAGLDGSSYESVWSEYADYLATYRSAAYATECDPAQVEAADSRAVAGMILNGRCAQLALRVVDVVDLWIAHRPSAPTALDGAALTGYWTSTDGFNALFVDLRRDGTFTIGNTGRIGDADAFAFGTYDIDGDAIRFTVDPSSNECVGETWTWEVAVPFDGLMEVDVQDNGGCAAAVQWQWTRVSPISPAGRELAPADTGVTSHMAAPLTPGIWLRLGTGEVVAIDNDRTYLVTSDGDTRSPADTGTVSAAEPGTWTFTSDGSGACEAGATAVWTDVTMPHGALDLGSPIEVSLSATDTPTCGSDAGGPTEWLLLAPDPNG